MSRPFTIDFTTPIDYTRGMNMKSTQMSRKGVSAPTKWILEHQSFDSTDYVLHHGEGKAYRDTGAIAECGAVVVPYDPYSFYPSTRRKGILTERYYDYAISNYVLNVIPPEDRGTVLQEIITNARVSYITVRLDIRTTGGYTVLKDGIINRNGSFQTVLSPDEWISWFVLNIDNPGFTFSLAHRASGYLTVKVVKK